MMDPYSVLVRDPRKFTSDLEIVMDRAAAAVASASSRSSERTTTPEIATVLPSSPRDSRMRENKKRAAYADADSAQAKKPKLMTIELDYDGSQHSTPTDSRPLEVKAAVPRGPSLPRNTIRHAVRRQWDQSKDGIAYEDLLKHRRSEHVANVDHYVPPVGSAHTGRDGGTTNKAASRPPPSRSLNVSAISSGQRSHASNAQGEKSSQAVIRGDAALSKKSPGSKAQHFRFPELPGRVKDMILTLLLVKDENIILDFTWLRPFINGHCRVPVVSKTLRSGDEFHTYSVPISWNDLHEDVRIMRDDCRPFITAMEQRGDKTRSKKSPCRDLTTSLLKVSRDVHRHAIPIFYGANKFHFPWASTAWMQLESFLATIGALNVSFLRTIQIHAPLWHRGLQEDYVEGSMLDLTSPASRLAVVKPPHHDRLLSAIRYSVDALLKHGKLVNFSLDLEHGILTDRWTGRYTGDRQLIAIGEAEEHVMRKQEGIALLKKLGQSLGCTPRLGLYHSRPSSKIQKHDKSEFRSRFPSVQLEAQKYGWQVDGQLKGSRW